MTNQNQRLFIVASIVSLLACVGQAASVSVSMIATGATAIPGGTGTFTSFSPDPLLPPSPCISFGRLAFFGAGSGGQQGIYVAMPSGPPTKVADLSTMIPGGIGTFTSYPPSPVISGGNVAFIGMGSGGQTGVYVAIPPAPPPKVADLSTMIAGGIGTFTAFPPGPPAISGGNVAFLGMGSNGQAGGYVAIPPGPPAKVADLSTMIPGGSGMFTSFPSGVLDLLGTMSSPAISGGNVAFLGMGSAGQTGVYFAIRPGPPVKVADANTVFPSAPANVAPFYLFSGQSISGSAVSFSALSTFNDGKDLYDGVFVAIPPGPPNKIADTNTVVPGGIGNFVYFGATVIDPDNVVFEGFSWSNGKGIYSNIGGSLIKIIDQTDTIGGKGIKDLALGPGGFSGDQVAFGVIFTDGSQGIALGTIGGNRCPLGQGYWKSHSSQWPGAVTLGNQAYSQSELLAILNTSTTSDASLVLARQLIAAKFNISNGSDPAPIAATIADADSLLGGFPAKLPYNSPTSSPTGRAMVNDATKLESYNTGKLTPGCVNQ